MAVLLATLFVTAIPLAVADGEPEPPVSEPVDEVPGTEPCHVTLDPDQAPYAYVDC